MGFIGIFQTFSIFIFYNLISKCEKMQHIIEKLIRAAEDILGGINYFQVAIKFAFLFFYQAFCIIIILSIKLSRWQSLKLFQLENQTQVQNKSEVQPTENQENSKFGSVPGQKVDRNTQINFDIFLKQKINIYFIALQYSLMEAKWQQVVKNNYKKNKLSQFQNHYELGIQTQKQQSRFRAESSVILKKEKLDNNNIGAKGVKYLAAAQLNIATLDLQNNNIGAEGAKYIASGNFISLAQLDLCSNKIIAQGVKHLTAGNLINLEFINLRDNSIGQEGGKYLTTGSFINLTALYLCRNANISEDNHIELPNKTNLRLLLKKKSKLKIYVFI